MKKGKELVSALVIREEPLKWILNKKKIYEIRGKNCMKRGEIWLIEKGSGTVVGRAEIVDSVKLTVAEYNRNLGKMGPRGKVDPIRRPSEIKCKEIYAWVIKNAKKFQKPIPYKHPKGAQSWVRLERNLK